MTTKPHPLLLLPSELLLNIFLLVGPKATVLFTTCCFSSIHLSNNYRMQGRIYALPSSPPTSFWYKDLTLRDDFWDLLLLSRYSELPEPNRKKTKRSSERLSNVHSVIRYLQKIDFSQLHLEELYADIVELLKPNSSSSLNTNGNLDPHKVVKHIRNNILDFVNNHGHLYNKEMPFFPVNHRSTTFGGKRN